MAEPSKAFTEKVLGYDKGSTVIRSAEGHGLTSAASSRAAKELSKRNFERVARLDKS